MCIHSHTQQCQFFTGSCFNTFLEAFHTLLLPQRGKNGPAKMPDPLPPTQHCVVLHLAVLYAVLELPVRLDFLPTPRFSTFPLAGPSPAQGRIQTGRWPLLATFLRTPRSAAAGLSRRAGRGTSPTTMVGGHCHLPHGGRLSALPGHVQDSLLNRSISTDSLHCKRSSANKLRTKMVLDSTDGSSTSSDCFRARKLVPQRGALSYSAYTNFRVCLHAPRSLSVTDDRARKAAIGQTPLIVRVRAGKKV